MTLWVNKVGPYNNPQETYNYYELPFCKVETEHPPKHPVCLWSWLNQVLEGLGQPPLLKRIPLGVAYSAGAIAEVIWKLLAKAGEPPITRFVAVELAKDHYFRIDEATRDIGYRPSVEMDDALKNTILDLSERGY